jgi:Fe-S cluster biogenesis protein NfuA/nitrite reductase/ring-hydroxylating ferredoxin subunit
VERFEAIVSGWDASQQAVAFAYRRAVDALNREALRRLIAGVKGAPGALESLRAAAADPVVYAVLRHHGLIQPSLQERVETALASVRPMLAAHGGDVELIAFVPPDAVEVRFLGNCDGCPASTLTFVAGVRRAIEAHCPEITQVRQVKGAGAGAGGHFSSPFADVRAEDWVFAAMLDAIPEGGIHACVVAGRAVILSRAGAVACFDDACAHLGLPLSDGEVCAGRITCLHHGFEYDLSSGECLTAPGVQLRPHAVRVIGERVEIRLKG